MALLITKGFGDVLEIGNQSRPNTFDLTCAKPSLLNEKLVKIDERIVLKNFTPSKFVDSIPNMSVPRGKRSKSSKHPTLLKSRKC